MSCIRMYYRGDISGYLIIEIALYGEFKSYAL